MSRLLSTWAWKSALSTKSCLGAGVHSKPDGPYGPGKWHLDSAIHKETEVWDLGGFFQLWKMNRINISSRLIRRIFEVKKKVAAAATTKGLDY